MCVCVCVSGEETLLMPLGVCFQAVNVSGSEDLLSVRRL